MPAPWGFASPAYSGRPPPLSSTSFLVAGFPGASERIGGNAGLFPMEFTFLRIKVRTEGPRACGPFWDWRNHEHKMGFRRDRGCLFRNDSDLRVAVLAIFFVILAVVSSVCLQLTAAGRGRKGTVSGVGTNPWLRQHHSITARFPADVCHMPRRCLHAWLMGPGPAKALHARYVRRAEPFGLTLEEL